MQAGNHIVLRWSAYEHEHIERSMDWYLALGILAISAAITSALFHDFFFAILVVIAAASLALVARTPQELAHFELSDKGVRINGRLHRYDEIISFWVEDEEGTHPHLLIDTTKPLAPNFIIPIAHIDPHLVRSYLKERADEKPMKEPLAHKIIEFIGL